MSGYLLKFKQTYSVKIGGRRYPVVKIGNQLWMAENLDYKFDVNGSQIPIGQSGMPDTPNAWYYNNDETNYGIDGTYKCGLLYNWRAVKYLDDNKSTLLPSGWHVPSTTECEILFNAYNGLSNAGTTLKALDNSIITGFPNNWNGTDAIGFSMLPAGNYNGEFHSLNLNTLIWTSSLADDTHAYEYRFTDGSSISKENHHINQGRYLRLVKDVT